MTDIASLGVEIHSVGVQRTTNEVKGFTTAAGMAEKQTKLLTGVLTKMASAAGVFIAAAFSTKAIFEFQDALAEVSTLVDTQKFSMEELSAAALDQARTFGDVSGQVKAYYQIISAGAGTVAQATSILEASNKLAVGGVTTTAIAADGLTSVLNAYGNKVKDATAVSDALFIGMRAGKTTIGELSAGLGKVAPLAAQTGVGFDELVGSVSALTKGGISTSEAITGVRAVLAAVAKPTSEAAKLSKSLGIEFNAAGLQAKGFEGFLADLVAKTGGNTAALAQLFGGVEALVPVMALSGQAGADFTSIMEQMADKAGATEEAFTKMAASPGFQANRLFGAITAEVIEMSGAMTSMAVPALTFLANNAVYLSDIMGRLVAITTVMGAYMAGSWVVGFVAANGAVGALTIGLGLLRGALIRTGLGALIVIAGEIVYQLYEVVKGSGSVSEAFGRLKRSGIDTFQRVGSAVQWFESVMNQVSDNIVSYFAQKWAEILQIIIGGISSINKAFGTGFSLNGLVDSALGAMDRVDALSASAAKNGEAAAGHWKAIFADMSKISDIGSMPSFGDIGGTLGGGSTGSVAKTTTEVKALGSAAGAANDNIKSMVNTSESLADTWGGTLKSAWGGFFSDFKSGLESGKSMWASLGDAAVSVLDKITNKALEMATNGIWDMILGALGPTLGFGSFGIGSGASGTSAITGSSGGYFPAFDGGGYTGYGARSGGLDGKGGFMAMMHPQETVTDHSMGQKAPMASNQNSQSVVRIELGPDLEGRILQQSGAQSIQIVQAAAPTQVKQAVAASGSALAKGDFGRGMASYGLSQQAKRR